MATFPFILLPAEIRLQIYNYLRPNIMVPFWLDQLTSQRPAFRAHMELCNLAVLRTCRLIYDEILPEWYGCVTYQTDIFEDEPDLHVLGVPWALGQHVPKGFRHIKSINLCLEFPLTLRLDKTDLINEDFLVPYIGIGTFAEIFSSPKTKLETLHVTSSIRDSPFDRLRGHPDAVKTVVRWMLRPLLAIRRLFEFKLEGEFWPRLTSMGYGPGHPFIESFLEAIREYGVDMASELYSNSIPST
ncbi:hypothetical protein K432DRAFT_395262 [Lepidopterella palustris CBS 459.81]|uniref:Uncharacterized protein n=1 Tax=Lepidopterella palustris CBS 459.81 TaxID=1314670 RepID=A0A8E2E635_9PEZI|nr:hypothetical protein K432DRAFT_395262 [Lepidopterella palustris CBS 459.81]